MRVLRAKAIRKYLRLYRIIFNIVAPYLVILDGNFIFTCMKYKLDVRHRLESLLQESNLKLFVMQSTLDEMRAVGQKATEALSWAQECCEVLNDTQTISNNPLDRYKKVLEKRRYFVATQDKDLRNALNSLPGVPVLYLNKVTMVLESPSKASLEYNNKIENIKMSAGETEQEMMTKLGKKLKSAHNSIVVPGEAAVEESKTEPAGVDMYKVRQAKKASAPNPMSHKTASNDSNASKKKKRSKFRNG